jgi:hypothetical protein
MRSNQAAKKRIKAEVSAIRNILNAWDPITGSPADEYDCLVDQIVSAPHAGRANSEDIASLITSELKEHFGISEPKVEIAKAATAIAAYWKQRGK